MQSDQLHSRHERLFESNRFVYPVLSRRSGGISIGVNLNPDKICNFDCIYCQVNRRDQSETQFVETDLLLEELRSTSDAIVSGRLFESDKFASTPRELRRLNDIAFSGDGEPTTHRNFAELMELTAGVKRSLGLADVKMVLITNASMFHREHVQRGLDVLDKNQGEVWAKLDAGSDPYYQLVERTPIPFQQILDNIAAAAKTLPLVIQSLFMTIHGAGPSRDEQLAYCDRLVEIVEAGGLIQLVQVYTIARPPAESFVKPLSDEAVDDIVDLVRSRTGLPAAAFYGIESAQ
ncbi:MAG: radical SAM protein [Pirellulaceae bacterium]|jgi:wyosine [tRNA(Phe)-imidazoG37] synthetase (radical SAM superfamily)|nr:radical SAM protein [Pirellulaceae bacterium]MDP7017661.1 radical SAM protein [Pirellulaceae bacterium]